MHENKPPPTHSTRAPALDEGQAFEADARQVLGRLRSALAMLIEAIPAPRALNRPTELERTLGLATTLAWQVHRLAHSTDPLAECQHVPGSAGIKQVLTAAAAFNVPQDRIDAVSRAIEDFESLVQRYAGDRPTFNTMAASLVEGEHELIDLRLRRTVFRDNSRVWGVQVKTGLCASLYHPAASNPALIDSVLLRGMREIRRLRPGAPFRLSGASFRSEPGHESAPAPAPQDAERLSQEPTILKPFSTQPLPELITRHVGKKIETYLAPGPIGLINAPTYYLASAERAGEWRESADNPALNIDVRVAVTKPCERILMDTFIHESMLGEVEAMAEVYGSLSNLGQPIAFAELGEGEKLRIETPPVARGRAHEAIHTPHVPRYQSMFEHVCRLMDWPPERFVLFRWEFRYPILGSVLFTHVGLPDYGGDWPK